MEFNLWYALMALYVVTFGFYLIWDIQSWNGGEGVFAFIWVWSKWVILAVGVTTLFIMAFFGGFEWILPFLRFI